MSPFGPADRVRLTATGEAGFVCGFSHVGAVIVCLDSGVIDEFSENEIEAERFDNDDERSSCD